MHVALTVMRLRLTKVRLDRPLAPALRTFLVLSHHVKQPAAVAEIRIRLIRVQPGEESKKHHQVYLVCALGSQVGLTSGTAAAFSGLAAAITSCWTSQACTRSPPSKKRLLLRWRSGALCRAMNSMDVARHTSNHKPTVTFTCSREDHISNAEASLSPMPKELVARCLP